MCVSRYQARKRHFSGRVFGTDATDDAGVDLDGLGSQALEFQVLEMQHVISLEQALG